MVATSFVEPLQDLLVAAQAAPGVRCHLVGWKLSRVVSFRFGEGLQVTVCRASVVQALWWMTLGNGFAGTIATAWRVYFEPVRMWTQEVAEKNGVVFSTGRGYGYCCRSVLVLAFTTRNCIYSGLLPMLQCESDTGYR